MPLYNVYNPNFTTIELGNPSDTTLARVSAGLVSIEGVNIVTTSGTQTLTNKTIDASQLVANSIAQASIGTGVVGEGPAYRAYLSADQTGIVDSTFTKLNLNSEDFDTDACYNNATNYRFTPNVAGYYFLTATCVFTGTGIAAGWVQHYKNGARINTGTTHNASGTQIASTVVDLVSMNGSTDYIEVYLWANPSSGSITALGGTSTTWAAGCLIRAS